ncbi:ATP-binding protein [Pelovirga terrestris]|uniref:histidine kinase n=1 Tax=Pelovirga terrestris TaxID=2771352 RepID=A0A8J6R4N9_9BACT|nr:PAS domain S-box protein [Pelovirga terrestris]
MTQAGHRSLIWYLVCRTAVITLVLGGAAFFYLHGNLAYSVTPLFFLVGISYVHAIVVALILPRLNNLWILNQAQIVWDLLLVSALILTTGAVESIFSFFYLLVIISASFLLSRRLTILAAASSSILFGGILLLQFYQLLGPFQVPTATADAVFLNSLFVHLVAFFLTAMLSGTLAERWRQSEALYQRKSIDFSELERMNRLILSHISSGVMLINPQGRIRAFNLAASDITGFSLQQVYDAPAAELFPEFNKIVTPDTEPVNRAEGFFAHPSGERLSFGYATTLVKGNHGEPLGTLVTFQDLTQLKKIEEQLKRSDRLAAIGRLSAGLAHEIRNPLASISGSAQLLGENEQLSAEDKHLLTIMVKEADRLNHLLTDFLAFARPHRPQKTVVDMAVMIAELGRMLQRDLRFQEIDVQMNAAPPCQVSLDRSQIWQVLWDLSINAAEAMKGQGTLLITYAHGNPWTLTIEDSGPGIAPEIRERIFEPFFSTKDKGTGLGLSTVYSIIEAHGGTIRAERSTLGGERFIMSFPHAAGGEDDQP